MRSSLIKLLLSSMVLFALFWPHFLVNGVELSAEQIAQFQSLPKAEQKRLAQSLGVVIGDGGTSDMDQEANDGQDIRRQRSRDKTRRTDTDFQRKNRLNKMQQAKNRLACDEGEYLDCTRGCTKGNAPDCENFQDADFFEQADLEAQEKPPLRPFGYDIFAEAPSTFAPVDNVPVPSEYIMGPGDTVVLQLYGKENVAYKIRVDRNGSILLPDIGPLSVSGLNFAELKHLLTTTVERQMIGVKSSISLGALRSIRVFILGDASYPGSYTVSGLSTITNALFVSGGIAEIGSLRNIQLKRAGKIVSHFDLYDLLLNGDTSKDVRLLPGDVIFIPPIGKTVGVEGQVRRPAIYEVKEEENVGQLIKLAGGLAPDAYLGISHIERINDVGDRIVIDLNLSKPSGNATKVKNADLIQIASVLESKEHSVEIVGLAKRPGWYAWKKDLKITDLIPSLNQLKADADYGYVLVLREMPPTRRLKVIRVNLEKAIADPGSKDNLGLMARDKITILSLDERQAEFADFFKDNDVRFDNTFRVDDPSLEVAGQSTDISIFDKSSNQTIFGSNSNPSAFGRSSNQATFNKNSNDRSSNQAFGRDSNLEIDESSNLVTDSELNQAMAKKAAIDKRGKQREEQRSEVIAKIVKQLKLQARSGQFPEVAEIEGNVRLNGEYPVYEDMTVQGLIDAALGHLPGSVMDYAILSHHNETTQLIDVLVVNLNTSAQGQRVKAGDKLYIFHRHSHRAEQLMPLVEKLKLQARKGALPRYVGISGAVRFAGEYPMAKGLTTADLISYAGGLTELAYSLQAEITRIRSRDDQQQKVEHDVFTLARRGLGLDSGLDLKTGEKNTELQAIPDALINEQVEQKVIFTSQLDEEDHISIKQIPNWAESETVTLLGEVTFPGSYTIRRGETLYDVITRAGGLNQYAYAKGAVFTRLALKILEARRLAELKEKLAADIAFADLNEGNRTSGAHENAAKKEAKGLAVGLDKIEAQGRMVIDLDKIITSPEKHDLVLRGGDALVVPRFKQEVTVVGEVQHPTSHVYDQKLTFEDYVDQSGGLNTKADKSRIYVVKASGRVFLPKRSKWFRRSFELEPGDTIVVPLDSERVKPLVMWADITQIIYNMAIAAAAVASF